MKRYLKLCRKYKKLIISFIGISLIAIVNTMKGSVLNEIGYEQTFWLFETISLLIEVFLLFYLWKIIEEGKCITVKKNENKTDNRQRAKNLKL